MTIAFIADLHLTPLRPRSTRWFARFAEHAGTYVESLYILGDLFDYWIGDDAADALGQSEIIDILHGLSSAGVNVYFMHGNRDFLVGDRFSTDSGCVVLPDPAVIRLGSQQAVLSHGDALCTDDVEHQQSRERMLKAAWKQDFLTQPIAQRQKIALRLRERSESSKQQKSMSIMDVNENAVIKLARDNAADIIIHGHTHRPGVHEHDTGDKRVTRFVLGDWYEQKSVLLYSGGSFSLSR